MLSTIPLTELGAFQSADREQCGLILAINGEVSRVIEVENVHPEPEDNFAIRFAEFESIENALKRFGQPGEKIVGFIHTHMDYHDVEPSDDDLRSSLMNPDFINVVYKPSTGEFSFYQSGKRLTKT